MPDTQAQFDGQNPVSGYTLFHGKDGQNFYLKGENLADDEIKTRVAKLRGQSAAPAAQATPAANKPWFERDNGQQPGQPFDLDKYLDSPQGKGGQEANVNTAKFGADMMMGEGLARGAARLLETQALPALKSIPYVGRMVKAIDESPGVLGKVARGATVGGTMGGAEGLLRGHGANSIDDAAAGAVMGGAMGVALPAIHKLSGVEPPVLGSPENPGPMSKIPNKLPASMRGDPFVPRTAPAPEPELGSPENPAFHSKLPSRLPQSLRGDPFAPPQAADAPEAMRQIEAATEPNPASVAIVPDERPALPSDRRGFAYSLTRTKGLPEAAQRGQPGAIDVLRQIQPTVVTPRSGGFDSANMQALRESLGITESVPQGNPTPYSPPAPAPEATDSAFTPSRAIVPDRAINPQVEMPLRFTDNRTGIEHSVPADELDAAANALYGDQGLKYSDLTPEQKAGMLKFGQGATKAQRANSPFYQAIDSAPFDKNSPYYQPSQDTAIDIPQGNTSPFEPSVTKGWLTPRKKVLQ